MKRKRRYFGCAFILAYLANFDGKVHTHTK